MYNILISLGGDVQLSPGSKTKPNIKFSICHWNLNSIAAHDYDKAFLVKVYIAVRKFDIVCISKTYLGSSTASDDGNFEI